MSNTAENLDDEQEQMSLLEKVKSDPQIVKKLRDSADRMIELENERRAINEQISAIREEVVAMGINRHGFAAAVARYKLTETDRDERELSYQASCIALGVEHQLEMFEELVDNVQRPDATPPVSGVH